MEATMEATSQLGARQQHAPTSPLSMKLAREAELRDTVDFWWSGEPIGLELARARPADTPFTVLWASDGPLGVTFGVDSASGRVVVIKSARVDVQIGDVLLRARDAAVDSRNFDEAMASLALAHQSARAIPLEFARAPSPVMVTKASGLLARAGVNASFELLAVGGRSVQFLSMDELRTAIDTAPRPCDLQFVRRSHPAPQSPQRARRASQAITAAASLAFAAAVSASIS